jgi:hypothetical protein
MSGKRSEEEILSDAKKEAMYIVQSRRLRMWKALTAEEYNKDPYPNPNDTKPYSYEVFQSKVDGLIAGGKASGQYREYGSGIRDSAYAYVLGRFDAEQKVPEYADVIAEGMATQMYLNGYNRRVAELQRQSQVPMARSADSYIDPMVEIDILNRQAAARAQADPLWKERFK